MRILVSGACGFIGRHVVQALHSHGHSVVAAVRADHRDRLAGVETVACDLERDTEPTVWRRRLRAIDAVVNCAGILRERRGESFENTHCAAPLALGRAALDTGAKRFIQISALGDPAAGEFTASKHRGDEQLLKLGLPVTVLRPSLVYAAAGSHGGTSLLRALAATPFVLPLPGDGAQQMQPIHALDLAAIVAAAIERSAPAHGVFEIGGPEAITLREYLEGLRAWLGIPRARVLRVPPALVSLGANLGEWLGSGPLGRTTWRSAQRGLALSPGALDRQRQVFGVEPRSFAAALKETPCHTQDRWHARLYPLAPVLRIALALVCLVSSLAGFAMAPDALIRLAAPLGLPHDAALALGHGGAAVDAFLGALLLLPRTAVPAARLLFVLALGYTLVLGLALPGLWLDPFGGLVKNLVLLPAIATYLVLAGDRR